MPIHEHEGPKCLTNAHDPSCEDPQKKLGKEYKCEFLRYEDYNGKRLEIYRCLHDSPGSRPSADRRKMKTSKLKAKRVK